MSNKNMTKEELHIDFLQSNIESIAVVANRFNNFIPELLKVFEEYRANSEKYGIEPEDLTVAAKFVETQLLPMLDAAGTLAENYAEDNGIDEEGVLDD